MRGGASSGVMKSMGEPCAKKKDGMWSGVTGRADRAASQSARVRGRAGEETGADEDLDITGAEMWSWRRMEAGRMRLRSDVLAERSKADAARRRARRPRSMRRADSSGLTDQV
jgi:hypothetical protein